jgi:hypothetical protein
MKIRMTKEKGFLILWQLVGIFAFAYAIHKTDYIVGIGAFIIFNTIFDKNNK